MYCTQCGAHNADDAKFCFRCGTSLRTVSSSSPPPVVSAAKPVEYAGFWRRSLASSIDGLILSVPTAVIGLLIIVPAISAVISSGDSAVMISTVMSLVAHWLWLGLLLMIVPFIYYSAFESSRYQATPGKLALGIIVTDIHGRRASFTRAMGRNAGKILSKIILYIGFIMAGVTPKKQALHDMLADCLVVMK